MSDNNAIGVIAPTVSRAGNVFLGNLIRILATMHDKVYLITGSRVSIEVPNIQCFFLEHRGGRNIISQILGYFLFELKIAKTIVSSSKNVDIWIFFMGGECMLVPMLVARLLGKRTITYLAGSVEKSFNTNRDYLLLPLILIKKFNLHLSHRIVIYSEGLIDEWGLKKYANKISLAHEHYLDFEKFAMLTPINSRDNIVGYVGRFSEEKGILNLIHATEKVLLKNDDIRFYLIGDGYLKNQIQKVVHTKSIENNVIMSGWVPHDELPQYLNKFKLLVIPSYTEGLPNVMLESMACGTPVLATSVGSIPDIIHTGETGILIQGNDPDTIAENILGAMGRTDLLEISNSSLKYVFQNYSFENALDTWKVIVDEV